MFIQFLSDGLQAMFGLFFRRPRKVSVHTFLGLHADKPAAENYSEAV
ncbi:hypothetical protein [Neisseria animaloris]|nr:hypothetical protein [Neisseria animaloris]